MSTELSINTQDGVRVCVESWNHDGSAWIHLRSDFGTSSVVLTPEEAARIRAALDEILSEVTA